MRKTALIASVVFLIAQGTIAHAALVSTILTLDVPTPSANTLSLDLYSATEPITLLGQSETSLSGTIIAEIDIDQVTGVISSFSLTGGDMTGSNWSMPVPALGTTLQGVGTTATAGSLSITPVPGGGFQADQHRILLTGGIVNPVNVPLAGTIIDGSGTGTLTSTRNGNQFDIFFSMNIDDSEPLSGGNLAIQGVVVGRGSVTAIPEPTSIFALTSLAAVVCIRRRR